MLTTVYTNDTWHQNVQGYICRVENDVIEVGEEDNEQIECTQEENTWHKKIYCTQKPSSNIFP